MLEKKNVYVCVRVREKPIQSQRQFTLELNILVNCVLLLFI